MKKLQPRSQIVIYKAETGETKIDVRFDDETVWLTQNALADLLQTTKQNISQHIKNIFEEGELQSISVVKDFLTTATDGKKYTVNYYNLDLIISVGYRVKSSIATAFRQWATLRLREYKDWYKMVSIRNTKIVADYIAFAVFQVYERNNRQLYEIIKPAIGKIQDICNKKYFPRSNPL